MGPWGQELQSRGLAVEAWRHWGPWGGGHALGPFKWGHGARSHKVGRRSMETFRQEPWGHGPWGPWGSRAMEGGWSGGRRPRLGSADTYTYTYTHTFSYLYTRYFLIYIYICGTYLFLSIIYREYLFLSFTVREAPPPPLLSHVVLRLAKQVLGLGVMDSTP